MTQETHEALLLAENLDAYHTRAAHLQAASELRRQHALIVQMSNALMNAHDHIEMKRLRISHSTDATRISKAITAAKEYLK